MTRASAGSATKSSIRAGVYVRISQDRIGAGLGVERQEPPCVAVCERKGWQHVETYVDNDVSASSSAIRPAWKRLLADIESGHINAIVGWHIDRLTRKPRELEDLIDLYEKRGVELATAEGDVDISHPTGRMTARVMGAAARLETEHKTARQKLQREQAAAAGQPNSGGTRPFGYLDDRVTTHPIEAELVNDAANRVLAGESLGSICAEWNARGTTTVRGKLWSVTALRQVLTSARISGRRETGGQRVEGGKRVKTLGEIVAVDCWEPIISVAASDRLRAMLTSSSRVRHGGQTVRRHLLGGLLTCGICDSKLSAMTWEKQRKYLYRCAPTPGSKQSCGRLSVSRERADERVRSLVIEALSSPELMSKLSKREGVDPLIAAQIERDEQELLDIAADRAAGDITRAEWAVMREAVDARLTANRSKLARQSRTSSLSLLDGEGTIAQRFDRLNLSQQRAIISSVIETVRVEPIGQGGGRVFDRERLQPKWAV